MTRWTVCISFSDSRPKVCLSKAPASPWRLQRPAFLVGQDYELRPPVMRVGLECNKPFFVQFIDDPLNVLTMRTQVTRKPCDRLRPISLYDSA